MCDRDDLVTFLRSRGISKSGLDSIRENRVNTQMLLEFSEEDIKDVFSVFKDRFFIRKVLREIRVSQHKLSSKRRDEHQSARPSDANSFDNLGSSATESQETIIYEPAPSSHSERDAVVSRANEKTGSSYVMRHEDEHDIALQLNQTPRVPSNVFSHLSERNLQDIPSQGIIKTGPLYPSCQDGANDRHKLTSSCNIQVAHAQSVDLSKPKSQGSMASSQTMPALQYIKEEVALNFSKHNHCEVGTGNASDFGSSMQHRYNDSFRQERLSEHQSSQRYSGITDPSHASTQLSSAAVSSSNTHSPSGRQFMEYYDEPRFELRPPPTTPELMECDDNQFLVVVSSSISLYSADDLLAKKPKRGKPTDAQRLGHILIRNAAQSSKIWNSAPLLKEIPIQQKELFFNYVFSAAPQLGSHRDLVWCRLREALQNRRKYILDKEVGKRPVKGQDKNLNPIIIKTEKTEEESCKMLSSSVDMIDLTE